MYSAGCDAPWFSRPDSPTVSGKSLSSPSMMYGSMKLFQIATNWKRNTVTRPGAIMGIATCANVRSSPAPSVRAASTISSGIDAPA
ncbi:hypothetical protein D3C76_1693440 [compost metagenome]